MKDLIMEGSTSSPQIKLIERTGTLKISGESYPENTYEFYQPIFSWIENYIEEHDAITLDLCLSYLNTSSIRCLLEIFDKLESAHKRGKKTVINWHYDPLNERALELAEEFKEDLEVTFNLIQENP